MTFQPQWHHKNFTHIKCIFRCQGLKIAYQKLSTTTILNLEKILKNFQDLIIDVDFQVKITDFFSAHFATRCKMKYLVKYWSVSRHLQQKFCLSLKFCVWTTSCQNLTDWDHQRLFHHHYGINFNYVNKKSHLVTLMRRKTFPVFPMMWNSDKWSIIKETK